MTKEDWRTRDHPSIEGAQAAEGQGKPCHGAAAAAAARGNRRIVVLACWGVRSFQGSRGTMSHGANVQRTVAAMSCC